MINDRANEGAESIDCPALPLDARGLTGGTNRSVLESLEVEEFMHLIVLIVLIVRG